MLFDGERFSSPTPLNASQIQRNYHPKWGSYEFDWPVSEYEFTAVVLIGPNLSYVKQATIAQSKEYLAGPIKRENRKYRGLRESRTKIAREKTIK